MLLGVPESLEAIAVSDMRRLLAPVAARPIARATRTSDVTAPGSELGWSMTPLPFLLICRRGHLDLTVLIGGRPKRVRLAPHEAMFCCSRSWLSCDQRYARSYVRFTIAEEYTLYAVVDRRDRPPYHPDAGDRLRGVVVARPLSALAAELVRALERRGLESPGATRCAQILSLVHELDRALAAEQSSPASASATWLALRAYVDAHAHLGPTRDEVGRACRIHPSHVSRLFAEHTGDTFKRYLTARQLGYARALLAEPNLRIADVAKLSGFESANYFVRVFHRRFGSTPGRWRRSATSDALR